MLWYKFIYMQYKENLGQHDPTSKYFSDYMLLFEWTYEHTVQQKLEHRKPTTYTFCESWCLVVVKRIMGLVFYAYTVQSEIM
jgi:hypothetical protein